MTDLSTEAPPYAVVWELANAIVASRSLHVVADLGVADHIDDAPVSAAQLGAACGADADALDRVLRLLATKGVFEKRGGGYAHTGASRLLRTDHPMSIRAFARLNGLPVFSASFAEFGHSVRTGRPAVERVDARGLWPYLQGHPDEAEVFEQAMEAKAHADVAAVLNSHDFSPYRRVADIAGGRGHLITAILDACEEPSGVLFELPNVAAQVQPNPRLDVVAGDFFTDPLPACDAYVLMNIVHDWDDHQSRAILSAVALAGRPARATVLVIETVMPEGPEDHWAKTLDVLMLAVTQGKERTETAYRRLFDEAGLELVRTIPTTTPFSILEGHVR